MAPAASRAFRTARPAARIALPAPGRPRPPLREQTIASTALPRAADPVPGSTVDTVACSSCDAVCCRLTVVLLPGDRVPERLTTHTAEGLHVMDRDEDGWCVAIDTARMCCSIYDVRPAICRQFAMGGPYCRDVRADYATHYPREIALTLC